MARTLHRATGPVTLVGGGPVDPGQLAEALALAPEAVAADGGGNLALPAGHRFAAVIGDMDSLRDPDGLAAAGVALHAIPEQDTTDLEKCLSSIDAPVLIGLGFLGGRIDHHLAAMNALTRHPERRVVLVDGTDLCFLCPPVLALDLPAGTRVSLFPMAPVSATVATGLHWPATGILFSPDGRIGTSNMALGGPVRLGFDAPRMLVILPADRLRPVTDRLRGA